MELERRGSISQGTVSCGVNRGNQNSIREKGCIDGSGFDDVDSGDDDDDDGKRIKVAGVQQQKQMQLKSQRSKMRLGLAEFGLAGRLLSRIESGRGQSRVWTLADNVKHGRRESDFSCSAVQSNFGLLGG